MAPQDLCQNPRLTYTATPLTLEQRQAALEKATAARKERAQVKDDLKLGKLTLRQVLESDSPVIGKMIARALLEAIPGVGKVKAQQLLEEIGIAESRRVRGLGANQKAKLLTWHAQSH
ncbi:integration host factor, actinobacterial type [Streptomyces sp. SBC-4]|nr:integration host factor, actinobacterial type [Streptomyces sp. SBC-4]MDV5143648.1 integration host factor, actinobacterial type [Streptomyces sp. SBC-4]